MKRVNMTVLKIWCTVLLSIIHIGTFQHDATDNRCPDGIQPYIEVYATTVSWKLQLCEGLETLKKPFLKHRWKALMRKNLNSYAIGKKKTQQMSTICFAERHYTHQLIFPLVRHSGLKYHDQIIRLHIDSGNPDNLSIPQIRGSNVLSVLRHKKR